MSRHPRSGSRARAPSPGFAGSDPPGDLRDVDDVNLSDPGRMLRHLVAIGALPEGAVAFGSGVPSLAPPDNTTQNILDGLEMVIQRDLASPAPVVETQHVPKVTPAPATVPSGSGKPLLRFPDPPVFEGDPMKLDLWLLQTEMYLRAYGVV